MFILKLLFSSQSDKVEEIIKTQVESIKEQLIYVEKIN